jgi:hypothetical protein
MCRRRLPLTFALFTALVLAGCAGSSPQQTIAIPNELPDPINVGAATLKLTDLPAGWAVAADDTSNSEEIHCSKVYDTTSVDSKTFERENAQISNTLDVYATVTDATADFATIRDPNVTECARQELARGVAEEIVEPGVRLVDATVGLAPAPTAGDESFAIRFTFAFEGPAGKATSVVDLVLVRVGRIIGAYYATDVDQPFDQTLRDKLVDVSTKRIPALP